MILLLLVCAVSFINSIHCQQQIYYRESNRHGSASGDHDSAFTCPGNGALTGIKYRADNDSITQLEFICSSAERIRSFGPFGVYSGNEGEIHCEPGQYISSFLGTVRTSLKLVQVRCRDANTLKGEGTILSTAIETGDTTGTEFDDLAFSNGARPVGVKIWTTSGIDAIQIVYSNQLVELCTENCDDYKEELSELVGKRGGKVTVFSCVDQGVITGLTLKYNFEGIYAIQFICTSGLGKTVSELIGVDIDFGFNYTGNCPPGTFIGSLHGRYDDWIIALGIRCVELNETGEVPKFDALGGKRGKNFDHAPFSERGLRPVDFQIHHESRVNALQVKYGNLPVAANCRVNRIEVVDDSVQAKSDGFEVIGVSTATTCDSGLRLLRLSYSKEVTEEVGIDTTDGGDVNWATEVSVSATAGVSGFGVSASVSVGLSESNGGSKSWSTSKSNASSTTSGAASGEDVYYDTPGACIIIGYVDRYTLDRDNVESRYHYDCQIGHLDPKLASIKVLSKTYGNAYFQDFQFKYDSVEQCTQESQDCVKALNANTILADPIAFKNAFFACHPSNSGKTGNTLADNAGTAMKNVTGAQGKPNC